LGGIFKDRALKDALDILSMASGNPLIFTYSSGFGAVALQLKQTRDNFCSNWVSLDWGKREWPPIGTIGSGGVRGVKQDAEINSRICDVPSCQTCVAKTFASCRVLLRKYKAKYGAAIISICDCMH